MRKPIDGRIVCCPVCHRFTSSTLGDRNWRVAIDHTDLTGTMCRGSGYVIVGPEIHSISEDNAYQIERFLQPDEKRALREMKGKACKLFSPHMIYVFPVWDKLLSVKEVLVLLNLFVPKEQEERVCEEVERFRVANLPEYDVLKLKIQVHIT